MSLLKKLGQAARQANYDANNRSIQRLDRSIARMEARENARLEEELRRKRAVSCCQNCVYYSYSSFWGASCECSCDFFSLVDHSKFHCDFFKNKYE